MAERDELLARADELGIEVNRRWGVVRLRQALEDAGAETTVDSTPDTQADSIEPETEDVQATPFDVEDSPIDSPIDSGDEWPRRIAPIVWVDQAGRRYSSEGAAIAGAQEFRDRSG